MQYTATNAVDWLSGKWTVQATNFPMWLKGDKLRPTFMYTPLEDGRLLDEVQYQRKSNGDVETITGYDQYDSQTGGFVWRGKGLLIIARSKWRVLDVAIDGQMAVIEFSKTLFTAAGIDVITRLSDFDHTMQKYAVDTMSRIGIQAEPPLKWLNRL